MLVSNDYSRFTRKVAVLQISRHWNHILAVAQNKRIEVDDIAIRILFNTFPFEIHVFDYHELLDDATQPPHHVMVANDRERWTETDDSYGCLIAIICIAETEAPCIVYLELDNVSSESIPDPPHSADDHDTVMITYVDEDGNALACKNVDPLYGAVRSAHNFAAELDQAIWSEEVLENARDKMVAEFGEEWGS